MDHNMASVCHDVLHTFQDNMNDLVIFYILACGTQLVPLVFVSVSLLYAVPFPTVSYIFSPRMRISRRLRNPGIAVVEQFLQALDSDILDYVTRFYLLALSMQLTAMALIIGCILLDLPLLFMPHLEDVLPQGAIYELVIFSVVTAAIQIGPVVLLVLGLIYDIPLPFLPSPRIHRAPPTPEITRLERRSRDFASVRLTRYQNLEKTIIYANCRDDRTGAHFKIALCQAKEENARIECFLYDDFGPIRNIINLARDNVIELQEIINPNNRNNG